MTTIAALAAPPPTLPTPPPVPALVQPADEFGRQQQEQFRARLPQSERSVRDPRRTPNPNIAKRDSEATDRRSRARVIPFPSGRSSADKLDQDLAGPPSTFVAQVIAQQSEPRISNTAFERGIAAYEATTARTDAFIGTTPPVELLT